MSADLLITLGAELQQLAAQLHEWCDEADLKLQRIMGYIKRTVAYHQYAWIGDDAEDLGLQVRSNRCLPVTLIG